MPRPSPYLRTTYETDAALLNTPVRRVWFAILVLALLALPFVGSALVIDLLCRTALAVIGAQALNLLTGYTGLVSLGHGGLMAAGAFASGIVTVELGAPFWVALPVAPVVGGLLGFLVGIPSLRLKGVYLALSTLALHFLILYVASEYQSARGFSTGIMMPRPVLGPFTIAGGRAWYYTLLLLAAFTSLFCLNVVRTRAGRAFMAIRDRDIAAAATGINVTRYKLLAFVVSSAITAFGGSLYGYYTNFVSVEAFNFFTAIEYIAMITIGGLGSILGSILGAAFVTLLPYGVDALINVLPVGERVQTHLFAIKFGSFGLLMALFLLFEPRGLVSIWSRVRTYFDLWPFRYHPLGE